MVNQGLNPEILLGSGYGHKIHIWDLLKRRHKQELDLGAEHQMVLELRPAHNPTKAYGFAGVVISIKDLSASIWLWYRDNGKWAIKKVIEIPAEPADPEKLPPILQGFNMVAPLVTDINLSVDDRFLYVSCWGTGEFIQFDVTDPFNPVEKSMVASPVGGQAQSERIHAPAAIERQLENACQASTQPSSPRRRGSMQLSLLSSRRVVDSRLHEK